MHYKAYKATIIAQCYKDIQCSFNVHFFFSDEHNHHHLISIYSGISMRYHAMTWQISLQKVL